MLNTRLMKINENENKFLISTIKYPICILVIKFPLWLWELIGLENCHFPAQVLVSYLSHQISNVKLSDSSGCKTVLFLNSNVRWKIVRELPRLIEVVQLKKEEKGAHSSFIYKKYLYVFSIAILLWLLTWIHDIMQVSSIVSFTVNSIMIQCLRIIFGNR